MNKAKQKEIAEKLNNYINGNAAPYPAPCKLSSQNLEDAQEKLNKCIDETFLNPIAGPDEPLFGLKTVYKNNVTPVIYSEKIPKNEIVQVGSHSNITIKGRCFYYSMKWVEPDGTSHPILKDLTPEDIKFLTKPKPHRKYKKKK